MTEIDLQEKGDKLQLVEMGMVRGEEERGEIWGSGKA